MYSPASLDVSELKMVIRKPTNVLLKKLKNYLSLRVHLKIEQDEGYVSYVLKEVGRDYIVVAFGENERIVPIDKIIFMQVESTGHYPDAF